MVFGTGKTSLRASYGIYDILSLPYFPFLNRTHAIPFFQLGCGERSSCERFSPSNGLDLLNWQMQVKAPTYSRIHRGPTTRRGNLDGRAATAIPDFALMIGYVGSHSVHVPQNIDDMDQVPLSLVTLRCEWATSTLPHPCPVNSSKQNSADQPQLLAYRRLGLYRLFRFTTACW